MTKLEEFKKENKWLGWAHKKWRLALLDAKIRRFRKDYQRWKQEGMPAWLRVVAKDLSEYDKWRREAKRLCWQIRSIENPDRKQGGVTEEMIRRAEQVPLERFIDIKRKGNPKMALCPFHDDTNPSLAIYDTNTYFCFSCAQSGSVIKYIQKTRGLDFVEAVKFLYELV